MRPLTDTQRNYLTTIVGEWERGELATIRGLAKLFGVTTTAAYGHIEALKRKGYVMPSGTGARPTDKALCEFGSKVEAPKLDRATDRINQLINKWTSYRQHGRFTLPIVEVLKELKDAVAKEATP